jgi:tRNA (cmo5U34)-methyltransferase
MGQRDQVFRDPKHQIVDFTFDEEVAEVFSDMIRRSVPGYETIVPTTGLLAARHLTQLPKERHRVYDLGCSLGASTLSVLRQFPHPSLSVTAVDNSPAMLNRATEIVTDERVTFVCEDIQNLVLESAGVVILNFVMQFIAPAERNAVLQNICRAMQPDGLLIVSEKLSFEDPADQSFYESAHLDYKRANGYSELEISQKRSALENVLLMDSEAEHRERFAAAGFGKVRKWFQCLNWASYLVYCP